MGSLICLFRGHSRNPLIPNSGPLGGIPLLPQNNDENSTIEYNFDRKTSIDDTNKTHNISEAVVRKMKLSTIFSRIVVIGFLSAPKYVKATPLGKDDADGDTVGEEIVTKSSFDEAQSVFNNALQEIMHEFSSYTTMLHHPLFFSRRRFPSFNGRDKSRSFSSWDPFSIAGTAQSVMRWSPRYEVIDDEDSFSIKVDVPGFHFHELNVDLEAGGRVLRISGTKEEDVNEKDEAQESVDEKKGSVTYSSHTTRSFQQKFTLDPSIDSTKMSANLDPVHGTLFIRAPRNKLEIEYKNHIPITQVRIQLT